MDAGAIAHLAQMILNPDSKLKVSVMKIITSFSEKVKEFNSPALHYVRKIILTSFDHLEIIKRSSGQSVISA